jgi:hypothetical protein
MTEDRTLTELEFVELAVRRTFARVPSEMLGILADELMVADVSQLDGGSDPRLWELNRLRRLQA